MRARKGTGYFSKRVSGEKPVRNHSVARGGPRRELSETVSVFALCARCERGRLSKVHRRDAMSRVSTVLNALSFGYLSTNAANRPGLKLASTSPSVASLSNYAYGKEGRMQSELPIGDRILEVVRTNPDCSLDEVVQQLPDLLWSDVFTAVDRLNRLGRLRLIQDISLRATSIHLP